MTTISHEGRASNVCVLPEAGKEIDNIIFFDVNGLVVATGRGWFELKGPYTKHAGTTEWPGNIRRKNKVRFDQGEPFYMSSKGDTYRLNVNRVDVYLPYIESEWKVYEQENEYDDHINVMQVHEHVSGIIISHFLRNDPNQNTRYINQLKKIAELTQYPRQWGIYSPDAIKNKSAVLTLMKEIIDENEV